MQNQIKREQGEKERRRENLIQQPRSVNDFPLSDLRRRVRVLNEFLANNNTDNNMLLTLSDPLFRLLYLPHSLVSQLIVGGAAIGGLIDICDKEIQLLTLLSSL